MNIGHAYMGIAAILVILGSFMAVDGIDLYGDLVIACSIPFILYGSSKLADARKENEAAEAEADAESVE